MVGITAEISKWRQGQPAQLTTESDVGITRVLTTTMADDPVLTLTLEPGTWKFEWRTRWGRGLGAAVSVKFNFNCTPVLPLSTVGYTDINGLYTADFNRLIDNAAADTTQLMVVGATISFSGSGYGTITAETVVALEWAQLASVATQLQRLNGSFFRATKIF